MRFMSETARLAEAHLSYNRHAQKLQAIIIKVRMSMHTYAGGKIFNNSTTFHNVKAGTSPFE